MMDEHQSDDVCLEELQTIDRLEARIDILRDALDRAYTANEHLTVRIQQLIDERNAAREDYTNLAKEFNAYSRERL